jgi:hypothetical protein
MRFPVMRFRVMGFRVPGFRVAGFRAPPAAAPRAPAVPPQFARRGRDSGYPAAESQQAGLDHLLRIALEQAAAGLHPYEVPGTFRRI